MSLPSIRLAPLAPALLLFSVAARLAVTYLMPNGTNFIDLHVYVDGAVSIANGGLYDFVYHPRVPPLDLKFTYPPFAALLFYPLHFAPFPVVAAIWQLGVVAALYGCTAITLRLLGRSDARSAMAWTAVAIWFEPMRHVFELGQIGALLMLAVLSAVYASRSWVAGLLVGVAAGVKLTPAIAGLFFLGARRWAVVVISAAVFLCSVAISVGALGTQGRYYFTNLLGDADRIGLVAKPDNQSLRGVVGYAMGRDAGYGPVLIAAIAVTVLLAALAWRAIDSDDALGRIVVVMLLGLLLSPISWTHHWVWVLPLIMWLMHRTSRVMAWVWIILAVTGPPWIVAFADSRGWTSDQWYVALAGSLYVLATLATFGYLATARRPADRSPVPCRDRPR